MHAYGNGLFVATEIFVTTGRQVRELVDSGWVRLWSKACWSRTLADQLLLSILVGVGRSWDDRFLINKSSPCHGPWFYRAGLEIIVLWIEHYLY